MSEIYPKDGSTFVTESIDRVAYRWAKYKPDGARQMGKPGRWQKQVWHGEWFKWENCEEPTGEISSPIEDGPISKAFKEAGSLDHWRHEVGKLHSAVAAKDAEIERLQAQLSDWQPISTCPYKETVDLWCVYGGEEFAQYDGGASIGKLISARNRSEEYGFFGNQSNDGVPQRDAPDLVPVAWRKAVPSCPPSIIAQVLGVPLTYEDALKGGAQ